MDLPAYGRRQLSERFWSRVDRRGADECWLWQLSTSGQGQHGQFTWRTFDRQVHFYAHRVAWFLTHGCAADLKVCHRCDVPRCCNPSHLFLGTQADNLNDARTKGRLVDGLGARKLTDAAYRDILNTPQTHGSGLRLAQKHGTSSTTVSRIRRGLQGSIFQTVEAGGQAAHHLRQLPQQVGHLDRALVGGL